jgi:hypothetical protein
MSAATLGLAVAGLALPNIGGCMKKPHQEVWLAVAGVHELGLDSCKLEKLDPADALEDLKWQGGRLVMRAHREGTAELACGDDRSTLHLVKAARLEVIVEGEPKAGAHFQVRAVPRDAGGRQLEIGKWAEVEWSEEGGVTRDNDPSAGEFGLCDTCFGQQGFKAAAAAGGSGKVRATFAGLSGEATITIR